MKLAYVCRFPMDAPEGPGLYALKYIDARTVRLPQGHLRTVNIDIGEARPPVRRRRSDASFAWDYANAIMSRRDFNRLYPCIHLKPGEGPILVDLDDISTKRTSRHPED